MVGVLGRLFPRAAVKTGHPLKRLSDQATGWGPWNGCDWKLKTKVYRFYLGNKRKNRTILTWERKSAEIRLPFPPVRNGKGNNGPLSSPTGESCCGDKCSVNSAASGHEQGKANKIAKSGGGGEKPDAKHRARGRSFRMRCAAFRQGEYGSSDGGS